MILKKNNKETKLIPGTSIADHKIYSNIEYLMELSAENLLIHFYNETGSFNRPNKKTDIHWGWDSPFSNIRGTFTGHWLSAAAKIIQLKEHKELEIKANYIVDEIKKCQIENGGEWAFPIPEKYLHRIKNGKHSWAPQYVCHKVMMGLLDMYLYNGNETALEVVNGCANWFYKFTNDISQEEMANMCDIEETGGIMELWCDLYAVTQDEKVLELAKRYERHRLCDPVLESVDVLTNMHANTQIPEIHGIARAYEITGDEKYRKIVENYWNLAVDDRGMFATGGQSNGEIWTPPYQQKSRLSDRNQEHCVVYNMMRLSDYLYRWTGEAKYADYWERNLYNGVYAQGFVSANWSQKTNEDYPVDKGLVAYYLPLEAGSQKEWGTKTDHFWCCHCTLVQANASFHESIYYTNGNSINIAQYLPSILKTNIEGKQFSIKQEKNDQVSYGLGISHENRLQQSRPRNWKFRYTITADSVNAVLKFRMPWWLSDTMLIEINGEPFDYIKEKGHAIVEREWKTGDSIDVTLPKKLHVWPLPDRKDTVAFLDGPITLVGLTENDMMLYGDIDEPENFFIADDERRWTIWQPYYRTINQYLNVKFVPIYEVCNERYTVYFQVKNNEI